MIRIFISYRRTDSQAITDHLYDLLSKHFGDKNVFQDVEDIPPGVHFREYLSKAVSSCNVLLVVVGPQWLNITDSKGKRRLDDPDDFVRIEIETGLSRKDILIVPVIVDNATIPPVHELPASMSDLFQRNAAFIRHNPYFNEDATALVMAIRSHLSKSRGLWLIAALFLLILAFATGVFFLNQNHNEKSQSSNAQNTETPQTLVLPSHTPTTVTVTIQADPTILYPDGYRLVLFYNDSGFYIYNPGAQNIQVARITLEALDGDGNAIRYRLEGQSWADFYPLLEPQRCVRIEILRTTPAHPFQCMAYNSQLTVSANDFMTFWIIREGVAQFRFLWNNEEIARCSTKTDECEVFLP